MLSRRVFQSIAPRFGFVGSQCKMSSGSNSQASHVIASDSSDKGLIILNKPKSLNAINLEMVRKIYKSLKKWEFSKSAVIIKGTGDKAFCAGGDVVNLFKVPLHEAKQFFREEYTTNSLIGHYNIPYIALIDGITMGGGVGLSVHGKYRVATERSMFAMPETAIGLFPDVGGSFFLPRLNGKLGMYLGLTGFRLKGEDIQKAGIATHYCDSSKILELETALLDCKDTDDVPDILQKFHNVSDKDFILKPHLEQINKCFDAKSVEDILSNLERDGSDWAIHTIKTLKKMSPLALKVTFHQLKQGAKLSMNECLKMEFRMACRHIENSDFKEGVRAMLVDKDNNPKWNPTSLSEVSQDKVQSYFEKLSAVEELKL